MGSELQRDEFIHHSSIKPSNQDKEWMLSPAERVGTDPVINTAALLTHRKSGPDC